MSQLTLIPGPPTQVPVEAECITPDRVRGLTAAQVAALPVWYGNEKAQLGDFFRVEGTGSDHVVIDGDVPHVKWIGAGMSQGRIEVRGAVGMHAGSGMKGGELVIRGSAGDWLGAEMEGGLIRVEGDAGHLVGAAYRGSPAGMRGGVILVQGSAGSEVGARLARGIIAIRGRVGDMAGAGMRAGTILVGGQAGIRAGAWMERGSIVLGGPAELMPTLVYACTYVPLWLTVCLRHLARLGFAPPDGWVGGAFRLFSGDTATGGKGEVLVWTGATG